MKISSSSGIKMSGLGAIDVTLPVPVNNAIKKWGSKSLIEKVSDGTWRSDFANNIIPSESYIDAIQSAHIALLSTQTPFTLIIPVKHVLQVLVKFVSDLAVWCTTENISGRMVEVMFPLLFDISTEFLSDTVWNILERVLGAVGSYNFKEKVYEYMMEKCYNLICHYSSESNLDESTFRECLRFVEVHLEKSAGKTAIEKFFTSGQGDLVTVLLSATQDNLGPSYGTTVLKIFNQLFYLAEKNPKDESYKALCKSLGNLADVDMSVLQSWLAKMLMNTLPASGMQTSSSQSDVQSKMQDNRVLLQSLTAYIVKSASHISEDVCSAILSALIPMGTQLLSSYNTDVIIFTELMVVMTTLAGSGTGQGHVQLYTAALGWMNTCKSYLSEPKLIEKLEDGVTQSRHPMMLHSACHLMSYIAEVLSTLKLTSDQLLNNMVPASAAECRGSSVGTEGSDGVPSMIMDVNADWVENIHMDDEEEDIVEDSDDEALCSKLCTYSVTQKEFINQHWYHCHTCKMVDGVGVCTVCAKVCHQDHDLSYAKYGSFFCDCGAKEDGSCIAMTKRTVQSGLDSSLRQATPPSSGAISSQAPSTRQGSLGSAVIHGILGRALKTIETVTTTKFDKHAVERHIPKKDTKAREVMCRQVQVSILIRRGEVSHSFFLISLCCLFFCA